MKRSAVKEELDSLIAAVAKQAKIAGGLGCNAAARLLEMSRLALQMERHDISDFELRALSDAIGRRSRNSNPTLSSIVLPRGPSRPRPANRRHDA
jgi:hypothetical protein